MRRLWEIFAQATTIAVGVLLAARLLAPQWFAGPRPAASPLPPPAAAQRAPRALQAPRGYAEAAARAMPAVVSVTSERMPRRPRPLPGDQGSGRPGTLRPSLGLGSGVLVSPSGYVLTNDHVIEGAEQIEVRLADGRRARATLVGRDPDTDLAVLRIALPDLPALDFADERKARVGDVVLAVGYPFGVGQTVTQGIISALGRSRLGINTFENFIQTDAAINPGNSGGALVDAQGRLLGINTAIYSASGGSLGIGFAVPASTAREVLRQLIAHGRVRRGWIGVEVRGLEPAQARRLGLPGGRGAQGVLVAEVLAGGPAQRAGLRAGDVLLRLDGRAVDDADQLLDRVAALTPGGEASLEVLRAGKRRSLQLKVGLRPLPPPSEDGDSADDEDGAADDASSEAGPAALPPWGQPSRPAPAGRPYS
ncbi:MAG: trypsin-like peptidase domain-containing protein [Betaproteobacteria bacterium]|nr:trypsin-like peptidase domain-containing protein [Betaproteobacteria bacterium]